MTISMVTLLAALVWYSLNLVKCFFVIVGSNNSTTCGLQVPQVQAPATHMQL